LKIADGFVVTINMVKGLNILNTEKVLNINFFEAILKKKVISAARNF
jgi:hypothetical protein